MGSKIVDVGMIPAKVEQIVPITASSRRTSHSGKKLRPDKKALISADKPDFYNTYEMNSKYKNIQFSQAWNHVWWLYYVIINFCMCSITLTSIYASIGAINLTFMYMSQLYSYMLYCIWRSWNVKIPEMKVTVSKLANRPIWEVRSLTHPKL